jgi:hypothetical protein
MWFWIIFLLTPIVAVICNSIYCAYKAFASCMVDKSSTMSSFFATWYEITLYDLEYSILPIRGVSGFVVLGIFVGFIGFMVVFLVGLSHSKKTG